MLDWILVGLIILVASLLLGRSLYRNVTGTKPTCACGHVDCPLAGQCEQDPHGVTEGRPEGCPLTDEVDASHTAVTRHSKPTM
jgi:hypothetical protein